MTRPHGLLGKVYAAAIFILAAIAATIVGIVVSVAPFWIIACITAALIIPFLCICFWLSFGKQGGG